MDEFRNLLLAVTFVAAVACVGGEDRNKKAYVAWFFASGLLFLLSSSFEKGDSYEWRISKTPAAAAETKGNQPTGVK